jgi:Ca2+-binding RTX toxin-like protein
MGVLTARFFTLADYFGEGFGDGSGGASDVIPKSLSATRIVLKNPDTGWKVIIKGSDFTFDVDGRPTGGTISGIDFKDENGNLAVKYGIPDWSATDFLTATDAFTGGDDTAYDALLAGNTYDFNFSNLAEDVWIEGPNGDTRVVGTGFGDTIETKRGDDIIIAGAGDDTVFANRGRDLLRGDAGNDALDGQQGKDKIKGGIGDDTITGGEGNDKLWGNGGIDTFIFNDGDGNDVIKDFSAGIDKIDFSNVSEITDFSDLINNQAANDGGDMVISTSTDTITLIGVNIGDLFSSDFIF